MSKVEMNLSVNGESKVPPGFRFHPTEEELLLYYLTKKVGSQVIDLDVIRDVDLNKLEPWDIQEKCKIGSTPQNDWYFFSHKDKKYPTGTRTNRATAAGFWKATGRDKVIHSSLKRIGMRKTLVFYKGRAPHGLKSDWIMHEYRLLDDHTSTDPHLLSAVYINETGDSGPEEGWVVCRVFKKKNYHKALENPQSSSSSTKQKLVVDDPTNNKDVILDQLLHYMSKSCKQEININDHKTTSANMMMINSNNPTHHHHHHHSFPSFNSTANFAKFSNLPRLKHVEQTTGGGTDILINEIQSCYNINEQENVCNIIENNNNNNNNNGNSGLNDWVSLDRLVASQLNGQDNCHFSCYGRDLNNNNNNVDFFTEIDHDFQELSTTLQPKHVDSQVYNQNDLWSCFTQSPPSSSSSDPLADLSA